MRTALPLLAALLALALPACGSSENRPQVVRTVPASGSVLDNVVGEFLVYFDDPVELLNDTSVVGSGEFGQVRMEALADDDDPRLIRIRPQPGWYILPGRFSLKIGAGLVRNQENQYAIQDWWGNYELGEGPNLFVGSAGRSAVVELDREAFTEIHATPTPGGRPPEGVLATQILDDVRVWTQLASGDGVGRSLAWFRPGDAGMTEVSLTTGGGDLHTQRPKTLFVGRDGRTLYLAFRDEALGRVRLVEVNVETGKETRTLVLDPPASADTWPVGVRTGPFHDYVFITVTTFAGDYLSQVDIEDWVEVHTQDLPEGAGPLHTWGDDVFIGNLPQATANLTHYDAGWQDIQYESASEVVGHSRDLWITPDGVWMLHGLGGFDPGAEICLRPRARYWDGPEPLAAVSTTGGANPPATAILQISPYRTQARFVVLFDNDALATFRWDTDTPTQDDLDDDLDDVQAADLSVVAPDARCASFGTALFPEAPLWP